MFVVLRRKSLIRFVTVAAVTLLCIGLYRSEASSTALIDHALAYAERAKALTGLGSHSPEDSTWDQVIDVSPLIDQLRSGKPFFLNGLTGLTLKKQCFSTKRTLMSNYIPI